MSVDWQAFTPWSALGGGVLIGLAAAAMVLLLGRILGVSGIVGGLLQRAHWQTSAQWAWRLAFVLGLSAAPWVWQVFAPLPDVAMPNNAVLTVVAGLLVGYGTRLGSGCTSGHGVCGLSRMSKRSFVAILVIMLTGATTVFVMRHVVGV